MEIISLTSQGPAVQEAEMQDKKLVIDLVWRYILREHPEISITNASGTGQGGTTSRLQRERRSSGPKPVRPGLSCIYARQDGERESKSKHDEAACFKTCLLLTMTENKKTRDNHV